MRFRETLDEVVASKPFNIGVTIDVSSPALTGHRRLPAVSQPWRSSVCLSPRSALLPDAARC
ncbi:MAG: hypothetical protein MZV63_25705 [Marinilabiliales bacterium]|nr:hypothetical protein [Marinilabiliales bacterium]